MQLKKNKITKFIKEILYSILVIIILYSFRTELFYSEVDNIAIFVLPLAIFLFFFIKFLNIDIERLSVKEILLKYIVILLFSLIWVKTFQRFILPIEIGLNIKNLFKMMASIIQASAVVLVFIEIAKKIKINSNHQKSSFVNTVLFALPSLAIMIIVWLAVYPGLMISDSTIIWTMVEGLEPFSDIHPITYTMILKLGSLLWNSPASAILFQIMVTAFAIGFTGWIFMQIGVSSKLTWIIVLAISVFPLTWLYAVTMLKDTLFTMTMIILIDIIVLAIKKPVKVLSSIKWYVIFGIVSYFILLTRHNGILPIFGILFICILIFVFKKMKKETIKICITALAVFVLFISTLFGIQLALGEELQKQEASPLLFTQPIHQMMTIYGKHKHEIDKQSLDEIDYYLDLEYADKYIYGWESLGYEKGYYFQNLHKTGDWKAINHDRKAFFQTWTNLVKQYPYTAYIASNKLNSIVWYSKNYGFTTRYVYGIFQDEGFAIIPADYKLPKLNETLRTMLSYLDNIWIIWRPAWAMLIGLILGYVGFTKRKYLSLIVLAPMILNNIGLLIAVPFPDTRFVYLNFYVLVIYSVILFLKKDSSFENLT